MDHFIDIALNWLDLSWIVIALVALSRHQWPHAIAFVLVCVLSLRLQVELMFSIGYPDGLLTFVDFPLLWRGFIVYGVFSALFLVLMCTSRKADHFVVIAAGITIFTIAFCVSTAVMVL